MPDYTENARSMTLPLISLRGTVAFPATQINIDLSVDSDTEALRKAVDGYVFLITKREVNDNPPSSKKDYFRVGTVAKVRQTVELADKAVRLVADGICRATLVSVNSESLMAEVICKSIRVERPATLRSQTSAREALKLFGEFLKYLPKFPKDIAQQINDTSVPGLLADSIANAVLVNYTDKQAILELFDPLRRLETLVAVMERELATLDQEVAIHAEVRRRLEESQREYYLREQLKVIKEELGMGASDDDDDDEIEEYSARINAANLPAEVSERLVKEVSKLAKTPYGSAECTVMRNYIDTCLDIPWNKRTKDKLNCDEAKRILDRDHTGLDKVKDRIIEFIAVKQLNPELKNQIICLVGAPGTGKTSVASSLAKALGRKYVRVSLGGVRDEADIRGHRKTYVASMPGRIVNGLIQSKVMNPLMLLDEIDKLTHDTHGDPASALLEVLDSEQNSSFRDHFVEIPVDLSDVLFICSANTLDTVPKPLIDRMEIIELQSYSRREKLAIAKEHLWPKQLKRHGLKKSQVRLSDDAIYEIIDEYTFESGVRNLERCLASLCRKTARVIVSDKKRIVVGAGDVAQYLGPRKVIDDKVYSDDTVGIVNGLAWTENGGELLRVEAVATQGSGKLELTGSLGDVMKESAHIAVTYIRSKAAAFGIDPDFYKTKDIHIHFPEGATPKDGPSAGAALVCALASELGGYKVRQNIAMTGEVTLHGRVLAVGGLREKTIAAMRAGAKTVLLPEENKRDERDFDKAVTEGIELVYCSDVDEYIRRALIMDAPKASANAVTGKYPVIPGIDSCEKRGILSNETQPQ